ncbi:MAG: hypothetical protein ACLQLG_05680 [Thermoguttaceae bacterium]
MKQRRAISWSGALAALVAAAAIAVGAVTLWRMDFRGGGQSPAEAPPAVDPALIAYRQTAAWPVAVREARALAVGPNTRIYIGGDRVLRVFEPDGTAATEVALDGPPQCLAVAGSATVGPGRIYVGMEDHVEVLDARGKRLASWQPPAAGAWLSGIAVAEQDVFVADAGNSIVWRYDLAGKLKGRIGRPDKAHNYPGFLVTSHYFPLALGADGLLHVVNPRGLRVEAFTFDGDLELAWGKGSPGVEGFYGCCNPAYLAAMADGRFVTMEKGARRVKIYTAAGKFQCVVAGPEQLGPAAGPVAEDRGRILVLDAAAAMVRVFEAKQSTAGAKP